MPFDNNHIYAWNNIDPVLFRFMASLSHNVLKALQCGSHIGSPTLAVNLLSHLDKLLAQKGNHSKETNGCFIKNSASSLWVN